MIQENKIVKVYTKYNERSDEWTDAVYYKSLGVNKFVHKDGEFQDLPLCIEVKDFDGNTYNLSNGVFRTIDKIEIIG
tara:strand:+ start:95 stop:325 length:231 start_codon:yes stop_codon:yes gene_type:complete